MTVLEVMKRGADFLGRKGVESPRLQAELLLAQVLQLKRMQLYLNFERPLGETELSTYREFIRRRGEREPLQHIIGSANFCGFELLVNRSVLIPRPETESLAEKGWLFLNELAGRKAPRALDLGTGSGCLAIALAVKCPTATVVAVDISPEALGVAKSNSNTHRVDSRITFFQGNLFAPLPPQSRFDLIISNPPYIPADDIATLQPEVRDFDPVKALDGGPDGLSFYRHIAGEAPAFLERDGKCMVEIGDGQVESLRKVFEKQNWIVDSVVEDYTHRPRIMIASAK